MLTITIPSIPDRDEDVDEVVVALVLRRKDPVNPGGDPMPDLGAALEQMGPQFTAQIQALMAATPFDPTLSLLAVAKLTDAESGGAVTVHDLGELIGQWGSEPPADEQPPSADPEPEPEPDPAG